MISPPAVIYPWTETIIVKLMSAISQVESGDDDEAIGTEGERGRFQLTEKFWQQWAPGSADFSKAHCRECAETVVMRAMKCWAGQLAARRVSADLMPCVLAQWFACGQSTIPTPAKADEIRRILNIYRS